MTSHFLRIRAQFRALDATRAVKLARRSVVKVRRLSTPSDVVNSITGESQRLASNPALARSIERRFPYIDPIHHLQVELLRRFRARPARAKLDERVQLGIHISINGIAAGLRNTG